MKNPNVLSGKSSLLETKLIQLQILGKRGYVPKKLIREHKILQKQLSFEVPTELKTETIPKEKNSKVAEEVATKEEAVENSVETPVVDSNQISEKSIINSSEEKAGEKPEVSVIDSSTTNIVHSVPVLENVSPSYEIVDGTTIPLAPNEPASDYSSQPVEDVLQDQEPTLSVHPHPSLVSSTLSFVSNVFDRVAEKFDKAEEENNEVINGSENEVNSEGKEEEKEAKGEDKTEELKEVAKEEEIEKDDKNVNVDENILSKVEDEVKLEKEELKEEAKVVKTEEENNVSQESDEEEDSEDDNDDDDEEDEEEEEEEKLPEAQVNNEEHELKNVSESESSKNIESGNEINPQEDINNNEILVEKVNSLNDQDSSVKDEVSPETVPPLETAPPPESVVVEKKVTLDTVGKPVTNQVPLPDAQIEEEVLKLKDNITNLEKKEESEVNNVLTNEGLKAEVAVPEAKILEEIKYAFEIEQGPLINQIQEPEAIEIASNASESMNEINNVNNVDSNYNFNNESEISPEGNQNLKIEEFIRGEIDSVKNNIVSSENSVSGENDVFNHNEIDPIAKDGSSTLESLEPHFHEEVESFSGQRILDAEQVSNFNEFPSNRNLLNVNEGSQYDSRKHELNLFLTIKEI